MRTSHRANIRVPALYLLIGIVAGLILAKLTEAEPLLLLTVGSISAALSLLTVKQCRQNSLVWKLTFLLASSLASWAYGEVRLPSAPEATLRAMPPREARLVFKIERTFGQVNRYNSINGIARITDVDDRSILKSGDKIYFNIHLDKNARSGLQKGHTVEATGILSPIADASSERQHVSKGFEAFLQDSQIYYRFERGHTLTVKQEPSKFDQFCQRMNQRFQAQLSLQAPESINVRNIYVAMLLGQKVELTPQQKERYRLSGTMHFFAISGLHIGVIATVIAQFLTVIRVPKAKAPLIGLPLLYLYVEITGAAPSAMRAFLMASFFWLSYACWRQNNPLSSLINSAIAVLIIAPYQLFSIGFQLSYGVVLSILLFGLPLYQLVEKHYRPYRWLPSENYSPAQRSILWLWDKIVLMGSVSLSAWLASAPLSAALFGLVSPLAIVLNMLLVNLAAIAIITGVLVLTLANIGLTFFAGFLNHSAWLVLHVADQIVLSSFKIPGIIYCEEFPPLLGYTSLGIFLFLAHLAHTRSQLRAPLRWFAMPPLTVVCLLTLGILLT